jgi:hypothetical protein
LGAEILRFKDPDGESIAILLDPQTDSFKTTCADRLGIVGQQETGFGEIGQIGNGKSACRLEIKH